MVRTRVKGNGSKAASSPATEPNFYTMEPCGPSGGYTDAPIMPDNQSVLPINEDCGDDTSQENELPSSMEEDEMEEEFTRVHTPEPMLIASDKDALLDEDPMTPVSQAIPLWDDDEVDDLGIINLEKPITKTKFALLPPVVTPLEPKTRKIVSRETSPPSLPLFPSYADFEQQPDMTFELHSGDQVFFEGLPFHYLESKDVEESLIHPSDCHYV
jgi:hypothetical protein